MEDRDAAAVLSAGVVWLGLGLPYSAHERLLAFAGELERWNRLHNLVADASPQVLVRNHLLDSLSAAPTLRRQLSLLPQLLPTLLSSPGRPSPPAAPPRVLDLGSGAGLPGIPLAIAIPEARFTLLEANGKKARFCRHAAASLGLANVEVAETRAERYAPPAPFDAAVARALGSLERVLALARPLVRGPLVAMKGRFPAAELTAVEDAAPEVVRLEVPGLDAERHLVVLGSRDPVT